MTNQPRRNKSKEELVDEMKAAQERERQKVLIKTTIFPALHDACTTIADAKAITEYASSLIQQKGLQAMYAMKTSDLGLPAYFKDTDEASKYKAFFESLESLDIGATITILDQLKRGINNYVENKVDGEPLTSVNIEDIINKSSPQHVDVQ